MKKQSEWIKDRLQSVMMTDRVSGIETLLTVLRSDIYGLLENYMYITPDDVELVLDAEADGNFTLHITARTGHLIDPGKLLD